MKKFIVSGLITLSIIVNLTGCKPDIRKELEGTRIGASEGILKNDYGNIIVWNGMLSFKNETEFNATLDALYQEEMSFKGDYVDNETGTRNPVLEAFTSKFNYS